MQKNIIPITITLALFIIVFIVAIHSIDKITERDCARGIQDACKYINN